jgi:hypothetical protein
MNHKLISLLVLGVLLADYSAFADESAPEFEKTGETYRVRTSFYRTEISLNRPQFISLSADSLGRGRFSSIQLRNSPDAPPAPGAVLANRVEYRGSSRTASDGPRWSFEFGQKTIHLISQWSESDPPEPLIVDFDQKHCHATLLSIIESECRATMPALLHLPSQGTFRISSQPAKLKLDYDARRAIGPFVKVSFPPATKETPRVEYLWEVTAIYPKLPGIENDPRFDGFRRNWLNILQVNPHLRVLANNSSSDACASCIAEYADIALHSPDLDDSLKALDLIRELLDRYIAGMPGYGFPGWVAFDLDNHPSKNPIFLDAYPNLLIGAADYAIGGGDKAWLAKNYSAIKGWADALLATDRDGNGLFEYELSGNSGSWPPNLPYRPANWWDTVGFGHEDAYSNALAYRALRGMEKMAADSGHSDDADRYRAAADKLRDVYVMTFFNPATGVLAGWKSADGQLHDYYFPFVSGIAIHNGLVPKAQANAIVDKLMAKMKEVGYTRFDYGLPGNLIPIARKDYVHLDPRWGGGQKEDNSDAFQIYENGGATACFAYFTLAALYDLDRREEADKILFPLLDAYDKGGFEGFGPSGMSYDWKTWDGVPWGYEGFLTDNYYALLAVLAREGSLKRIVLPLGSEKTESP